MANQDRPKGFRPYEAALRERPHVAGGTVYPGDAVNMNASGQVVTADASEALMGVAASYGTSGSTIAVWDDPEQLFVVQADDGTSIAQADVGLNYNIVATAGSATYKQSRMELDSSSGATASTLPLRLMGLSPDVNEAAGEFAKCVVAINNHQLRPGTEGA